MVVRSHGLERVCEDAGEEGDDYVEAYPLTYEMFEFQYHGTIKMYERIGFVEYKKRQWFTIMRKAVGSDPIMLQNKG